MKFYAKKFHYDIEDLPYKGKSLLTSRFDDKLIEFRRFSLKFYLNTLLLDNQMQKCPALKYFLNINEIY